VALPQFIQAKACRRLWANDHPAFGDCAFYLPGALAKTFPAVWDWHQPEMQGAYWPEFTPKFVSVKKGSAITIAPDVTLKAFPVFHGFGEHPAVAYRLETPAGVIAYSGDSAVCDGLVEAAAGADLFICEQAFRIGYEDRAQYGHLTPKDVGIVCSRANPKQVWLTHYVGLDDEKDVLREIKSAGFHGSVQHAKDGDRWEH
jgi:ribonuclease BN (tRNA processing enzyme)